MRLVFLLLLVFLPGCASISLDDRLAEGKRLYGQKRCNEALSIFQEIVERDPKRVDGHLWMARCIIERRTGEYLLDAFTRARIGIGLASSLDHPDVKEYLQEIFSLGVDLLNADPRAGDTIYFRLYTFSQPFGYSPYLDVGKVLVEHSRCEEGMQSLAAVTSIEVHPRYGPLTPDDRKLLLKLLNSCAEKMISKGDNGMAHPYLMMFLQVERGDVRACARLEKIYRDERYLSEDLEVYKRGLCPMPEN